MKNIKIYTSALLLSASIFFYLIFLQIENILVHYFFHADKVSFFSEVQLLLLNQFATLVFAILTLLVFYTSVKSVRTKWLSYVVSIVLLFYLTIDQLFYTIYIDHIRYGFDPEGQSFDPALLKDSVLSIIDYRFYINSFIVAGICIWNYYILFRKTATEIPLFPSSVKMRLFLLCIPTYSISSYFLKDDIRKEFQNPFFILAESIYEKNMRTNSHKISASKDIKDLYSLRFATPFEPDNKIIAYLNNRKDSAKKYNIIYIVLESVGAINLLKDNCVNPALAPNLYALRNKTVLFPDLHCSFPATTKSHIPIISGGNTITYGSLPEIRQKYNGPTLISELKKERYRTGLFTAQFMDFEELDSYYHLMDLDEEFMPETMPESYTDLHKMNSWGIDEKEPVNALIKWISKNSGQPFFAEFMNVGTHHPYSVPSGFQGPFKENDEQSKYYNAIYYTDLMIGKLITYLKENQLYDNTVICISGDHGEAFGDRHYGNYLHKNFLYEENVRNFLLILDPELQSGPIVSSKKGSIGDIMPTILSYGNINTDSIPGQNLLSREYKNKINYFSKNSYPEIWGLLDGEWKFIVQTVENKFPELYNLKNDPLEKNNLAARYPKQVALYQTLLPDWYIRKNKAYTKHLENYRTAAEDELTVNDIQTAGPKNLLFGNINNDVFTKKMLVHPKEKIFVWAIMIPFPEDVHLRDRWISPSGKITESDFYINKEWSTVWKAFERKGNMEEGTWECQIIKDNQVLIKNTFQVSARAVLTDEYFYEKGPVKLYFGVRNPKGYINLDEMHPNETVIAFSQINPYETNKELTYIWFSPSNKRHSYPVPCKAGWNYTWLILSEGKPMEEGLWKIMVYNGKKKILESNFTISSKAKLYYPAFQ